MQKKRSSIRGKSLSGSHDAIKGEKKKSWPVAKFRGLPYSKMRIDRWKSQRG